MWSVRSGANTWSSCCPATALMTSLKRDGRERCWSGWERSISVSCDRREREKKNPLSKWRKHLAYYSGFAYRLKSHFHQSFLHLCDRCKRFKGENAKRFCIKTMLFIKVQEIRIQYDAWTSAFMFPNIKWLPHLVYLGHQGVKPYFI